MLALNSAYTTGGDPAAGPPRAVATDLGSPRDGFWGWFRDGLGMVSDSLGMVFDGLGMFFDGMGMVWG